MKPYINYDYQYKYTTLCNFCKQDDNSSQNTIVLRKTMVTSRTQNVKTTLIDLILRRIVFRAIKIDILSEQNRNFKSLTEYFKWECANYNASYQSFAK